MNSSIIGLVFPPGESLKPTFFRSPSIDSEVESELDRRKSLTEVEEWGDGSYAIKSARPVCQGAGRGDADSGLGRMTSS